MEILALPKQTSNITIEEKNFYRDELINVATHCLKTGKFKNFPRIFLQFSIGSHVRDLQPLIISSVNYPDASYLLCSNMTIHCKLYSYVPKVINFPITFPFLLPRPFIMSPSLYRDHLSRLRYFTETIHRLLH